MLYFKPSRQVLSSQDIRAEPRWALGLLPCHLSQWCPGEVHQVDHEIIKVDDFRFVVAPPSALHRETGGPL